MERPRTFLDGENVQQWLFRADELQPGFKDSLKFLVFLERRNWPYKLAVDMLSVTRNYCMLQDLAFLPCPEVEEWLTAHVLPQHNELAHALEKMAMPTTILDHELVKGWFSCAEAVGGGFCDFLRPLIMRRCLGFAGSNAITANHISAFEAMCEVLDRCCDPLHAWLKEAHDLGEAMAVDPPNSPCMDLADKECATTSTAEPEGATNDEDRRTKQGTKRKAGWKEGQPQQISDEDTSSSLARKRPKVEQTTKSRQRGRADTAVPRKTKNPKNMERASASPESRQEEGPPRDRASTLKVGSMKSAHKVAKAVAAPPQREAESGGLRTPLQKQQTKVMLRLPRRPGLSSTKISFPQRDAPTFDITGLERELRQQMMRTWAVKQCLEKIDNAVDR